MLRSLLWFLMLLGLPGSGIADETGLVPGSKDVAADVAPAASAPPDPKPVLDLNFDPALTQTQPWPSVASFPGPADAKRASEPRFSFGLDLRTRHEVGDEAREDSSGTLTEEVTGIMRRSTFGVKGTYRF